MRSAMSFCNSMRIDSTCQSELLMNSSTTEPIALPSALITVRPRRLSSDSRIGSPFVRSTIVVPADQCLLVARIAIDDAARYGAAHVRQLLSCPRSAPAPQRDENAPEREREHGEMLSSSHLGAQRCKLVTASCAARAPTRETSRRNPHMKT